MLHKQKEYTIGEIEALYFWLQFNVAEGYFDQDIADDLLEARNYKEIERLRNMSDLYSN